MLKEDIKTEGKTFRVHEDLSFNGYIFDKNHTEVLHEVHNGHSCKHAHLIEKQNRVFIKNVHAHKHEHHICHVCHEHFHEHEH